MVERGDTLGLLAPLIFATIVLKAARIRPRAACGFHAAERKPIEIYGRELALE